jgi:hypothetical protein
MPPIPVAKLPVNSVYASAEAPVQSAFVAIWPVVDRVESLSVATWLA